MGAAASDRFEGRRFTLLDGRAGPGPAPLVLVLHGGGGTGGDLRRAAGLDALAKAFGIVLVLPDAPGRTWNDGRVPALRGAGERDDSGYLARLLRHLLAETGADPARVLVLGHSNGGGMAVRLACERPDLVAGLAVVATKALADASCPDPRPVAAIFFFGTLDRVSPHAGVPEPDGSRLRRWRTLSAAATEADWRARNRCRGEPVPEARDPAPDATRLLLRTYRDCAAPLRVVEIVGGGHAWPGAAPYRPGAVNDLLGPFTRDIDAGPAALGFLLGR